MRPVLDAEGKDTGTYEVPAGGRRFRALELLVKQKRLARTAPVPCVVSEAGGDILIDEVSLAESIERAPLHPLDQFRAFQALREKGMTEEAIAAAFFVGVAVVKQRLRLASVSPILLDVYADEGMTLEQLMAFTVSEDHARQEQVWTTIGSSWNKEPYQIRRMLTEATVRASDRRALFVGVEAYEAAGGLVLRDLFQSDDGGWLQDAGLLDRLVTEKLKAAADAVADEGWKWVEAAVSIPYGTAFGLRALDGMPLAMTEAEAAQRAELQAEFNRLNETYDSADELPDEVDARLGEIEAALDAIDTRPLEYDPAEVAIAGVFVSVSSDGSLNVQRGFVRLEDEPRLQPDDGEEASGDEPAYAAGASAAPSVQRTVITVGGQPAASEAEEEDDGIRPLPDRLITELTAHRTLALRDAVAGNPRVAMTALLHKLASDAFGRRSREGCLEAEVREVYTPVQADDLGESVSATSVAARHARWSAEVPNDDDALWDWLAALDTEERMALPAHCVSLGVNALHERPNPYGVAVSAFGLTRRLAQADRLARATGLDMVEAGWRPTVGNYLGRVTKARILEAVREGAGEQAAQLIDHLKKGDMAREAERLLADRGWLPEPLRLVGDDAADAGGEDIGDEEGLPAFLADDDETGDEAEDDEPAGIAAE